MTIKYEGFAARGGWWVVAQFTLFGLILLALTRDRGAELVLQVAGWALFFIGGAGSLAGLWAIRDKLTALPAPLDHAVLRQRGAYSIVRHPIYGGLILGFFGLALQGGNLLAIALSLALIPFFYAKTSVEEKMLVDTFPEYRDYRKRVPFRVLPWIL